MNEELQKSQLDKQNFERDLGQLLTFYSSKVTIADMIGVVDWQMLQFKLHILTTVNKNGEN